MAGSVAVVAVVSGTRQRAGAPPERKYHLDQQFASVHSFGWVQ